MKRDFLFITIFLTIVFLLLSCDKIDEELWKELKDGVPSHESVKLKIPETSSVYRISTEGETGELYSSTRNMTQDVNSGAMRMLTMLDELLTYKPSETDDDSATWGPWQGEGLSPVEYKAIVTKNGNNSFEYEMLARPKDGNGEWLAWFFGSNKNDGETARHGIGIFTINFDNLKKYDETLREEGVIEVDYDTLTEGRKIDVIFKEFKGKHDEDAFSATYYFSEKSDLSGEFIFTTMADIHDGLENGEEYQQKENWLWNTKWNSDGSGRSDAVVTGGDIDQFCSWGSCLEKAVYSECWGSDFKVTYSAEKYYKDDETTFDNGKTEGLESNCVFE